jgi:hypothetical protein
MGYIYVIRKALDEANNSPIYKVGKTISESPNKYLNSRYDRGFKIHHLLEVNDADNCEILLLRELNMDKRFKLVQGREMFELLADATVKDIEQILAKLVDDNKNGIRYESTVNEHKKYEEILKLVPKKTKVFLKNLVNKYYDIIPSNDVMTSYYTFLKHDEFKEFKGDFYQEYAHAVIYDLLERKYLLKCDDFYNIRGIQLKDEYIKKLKINERFTESNVVELFVQEKHKLVGVNGAYSTKKSYDNYGSGAINPARIFKIAEFIINNTPFVGTTIESFEVGSYSFKHRIEEFGHKYKSSDCNYVGTGEAILACYILDVNMNGSSGDINIIADTRSTLYKENLDLVRW